MELNNLLLIIYIIVDSIQYRNKELVFNFIVALILTKGGFITEIIQRRITQYHFTTLYKFIERENWLFLDIHQKIILVLIRMFKLRVIYLIIDDTFIYRSRKEKVLKGSIFYDHSKKPNKKKYIYGQNLLLMAAVVKVKGVEIALPIIAHILTYGQEMNSNKITSAKKMLLITKYFLEKYGIKPEKLTVLSDAFFSKKNFFTCHEFFSFVVQIRHDSALFLDPPKKRPKHKRGRKPKYGKRITVTSRSLRKSTVLNVYGKEHIVHYLSRRCRARVLNGQEVIALWLRFDEQKKIHLIISTDLSLSPMDLLRVYEKRNMIESLFNDLKNHFGLNKLWYQKEVPYAKMLYLKLWTYIIIKISSVLNKDVIKTYVEEYLPWRIKSKNTIPVTAGITQLLLSQFLGLMTYKAFQSKVQKIIKHQNLYEKNKYFTNNQMT
ncbi:MAG: transposase [Bacteroidota bacterium]|nr:transposase [Bacteroidota bacterium]